MVYDPKFSLAFPAGRTPGFDPNHIAAKSVTRFSGVTMGNGFANILSGKAGAVGGTPSFIMDGAIGPAQKFSGASDDFTFANQPTANDQTVTLAVIMRFNAVSTNQGILATSSTDAGVCLACATGPLVVRTQTVNNTIPWQDFAFTNTAGFPFFCAISLNGTTCNSVIRRLDTGRMNFATQTLTNVPTASNGTYVVGNLLAFTIPALANISAAMFSTGFLSTAQLIQWAGDPWSFWYPDREDQFVGVLAAGGAAAAGLVPSPIFRPGSGPTYGLSTTPNTFIPPQIAGPGAAPNLVFLPGLGPTRGLSAPANTFIAPQIAGPGAAPNIVFRPGLGPTRGLSSPSNTFIPPQIAGPGSSPNLVFRPGLGPAWGLVTPLNTFIPLQAISLFGRAGLMVRAQAGATVAMPLTGRITIAVQAQDGPTVAMPLAGRAGIAVQAKANASVAAAMLARASLAVQARGTLSGAAALSGLAGIAVQAKGTATATAAVTALAGLANAAVNARAAMTVSMPLSARAAIATRLAGTPGVTAFLAAATKITSALRAGSSFSAALQGRVGISVQATDTLSGGVSLTALAGLAKAIVTARGALSGNFPPPPSTELAASGRHKRPLPMADREARVAARIAAEQQERQEKEAHAAIDRAFKRIASGLPAEEPVVAIKADDIQLDNTTAEEAIAIALLLLS